MKRMGLFILLIVVSACSKGDEQIEEVDSREAFFLEAIIGSWSYDTVKVNGDTFIYEHKEGCPRDLFQFYNEPGKEFDFEERIINDCPNCAECAGTSTGLEWELKGNKIELFFGEQLILIYELLEVNENVFIYSVETDLDQDGTDEVYEITAIPYDPFLNFN